MDTAEISYRVADFLKQHPPFTAIKDTDLLALAARGRVRFHEPSEYILWQGEPHRHQVFVIQQGTVSLWDDAGAESVLKDVRGAGDLLGIERYNDAPCCAFTVRSESEVVIYAFPADDFSQCVLAYPHAVEYVAADERVTAEYQGGPERRDPHRTFLHSLVGQSPLLTCRATETVANAAIRLVATRAEAIAVLNEQDHLCGVLTSDAILRWAAAGGGDATVQSIAFLLDARPAVASLNASASDGVLAMSTAAADAVVLTADGTATGRPQAVITPRDLAPLFGEQPANLLRQIRCAASIGELRTLNQRARALTLQYLTTAAAVDWLGSLTHAIDVAIVGRILALNGVGQPRDCWCFAGSAGRGETLTLLAAQIVIVAEDSSDLRATRETHGMVLDALTYCGYLQGERAFDTSFYVASAAEWKDRYSRWVRDPIMQHMYLARTLFDLRPVLGPHALAQDVESAVTSAVDSTFLFVLANDCLGRMPPLTFYEDAVVNQAGEHTSTFRLDQTALQPLVDVGRVVGIAGGAVFGRSTLDRFASARTLLPSHERIFREAADTLRVVLWQQGRVGIIQGTTGAELPPALLSRHDRHVLKSGFRSIRELIEFTADPTWFENL